MKHAFPLLLCAPLLLSACVMEPVPMPPPDPQASCGADQLQYLVGRPGVQLGARELLVKHRLLGFERGDAGGQLVQLTLFLVAELALGFGRLGCRGRSWRRSLYRGGRR